MGGRRVVRFGGRSAKKGRSGSPLSLGSALEPTLSVFDPRLKPPLHSALLSLFYPGGVECSSAVGKVMVCLQNLTAQCNVSHSAAEQQVHLSLYG